MNIIFLILQVVAMGTISLVALRISERALNAWLCVVALSMNIFVFKQISIFGFEVTTTESLAVGYILGLNLIQEYYGRSAARSHVMISFLCSVGFIVLSFLHLAFIPNVFDRASPHFNEIFSQVPRVMCASLISFITVQLADIQFFEYLNKICEGRWMGLRTFISLCISQILDTLVFSFLGLYGVVGNITHVIVFSLIIKLTVIFMCAPFAEFSKKFMVRYHDKNQHGSFSRVS